VIKNPEGISLMKPNQKREEFLHPEKVNFYPIEKIK
jgi:hypothetical protein